MCHTYAARTYLLSHLQEVTSPGDADESWVPVKARKHVFVVGSSDSDSSWPGSAASKAMHKEEEDDLASKQHDPEASSLPPKALHTPDSNPQPLQGRSSWPRDARQPRLHLSGGPADASSPKDAPSRHHRR